MQKLSSVGKLHVAVPEQFRNRKLVVQCVYR
jgi:hypothetical protein